MLPAVLPELVDRRPQALLALEVPRRTGAEGAADADASAWVHGLTPGYTITHTGANTRVRL